LICRIIEQAPPSRPAGAATVTVCNHMRRVELAISVVTEFSNLEMPVQHELLTVERSQNDMHETGGE
jgi:hypothetical protein